MKIICIGRNYADHAKELKNDIPKEPVIFIKPDSAVLQKRNPFYIPDFTANVHFELELVVKINRLGKHIQEKFAHKYYDEIGLGIDFTARDLQEECKEKGLPWEKAKAFDGSCVLGKFIPVQTLKNKSDIEFHLTKNGEVVQQGQSSQMLFDIDRIIAEVSRYFTLKIGDLIFTGTPAGVGKIEPGDELQGYLEGQPNLKVRVK